MHFSEYQVLRFATAGENGPAAQLQIICSNAQIASLGEPVPKDNH